MRVWAGRLSRIIHLPACSPSLEILMSDGKSLPPAVPTGWTLVSTRYHYDFTYWMQFVLDLLSQSTTARPDVTYTVRRDLDGSSQSIRLPGDHSPEALGTTLLLIEREATAG
jgi:hypothetical protein